MIKTGKKKQKKKKTIHHLSLYSKRLQIYHFLVKQGKITYKIYECFFCNYCSNIAFPKELISEKQSQRILKKVPTGQQDLVNNLLLMSKRQICLVQLYWLRFPDLNPQKNLARPHVANRWCKVYISYGYPYLWIKVGVVLGVFHAPCTLKLYLVGSEKRQQILTCFNI